MAWLKRPIADTEPRVQQLSDGPYPERGVGPQGLASAGLCVFWNQLIMDTSNPKNLLPIIVAVLIVGLGAGYLLSNRDKPASVNTAQNNSMPTSTSEQVSTSDQTNQADQKIQKLQNEVEQLKQWQQRPVAPQGDENYSTIAAEWQNRVAEVICSWNYDNGQEYLRKGGSSLLVKLSNLGIVAITNKHVVTDDTTGYSANQCMIGVYGVGARITDFNANLDAATTPFGIATDGRDFAYIYLDSKHSGTQTDNNGFDTIIAPNLKTCSSEANIGDKVIVLGYPAIGTVNGITVTDGIISGIEGDYYVTSAKIDHGNSGGAAILLKDDCYLGIPTWVEHQEGGFESLGRILKSSFVVN